MAARFAPESELAYSSSSPSTQTPPERTHTSFRFLSTPTVRWRQTGCQLCHEVGGSLLSCLV